MSGEKGKDAEQQLQQITGALDVLFTLREEFAQWVGEAQDKSKGEALENVLRHVEAMEAEYQRRREEAEKGIKTR